MRGPLGSTSIQPSTGRIIKPRLGRQVANLAGGTGERWKSGPTKEGGFAGYFCTGGKEGDDLDSILRKTAVIPLRGVES